MTPVEIAFRPLARRDFGLLAQWLGAPHVLPWWREGYDAGAIEERYGPTVDGTDPTEVFVIERNREPVGIIQRYRLEDNPAWQTSLAVTGTRTDAAGIDYLIGVEGLTGHGLGPAVIDRFVEGTWTRYPDIGAVVVNVHEDNRRSWRALEKAGFRRAWTGELVSDDPSDEGTSHVYVRDRPPGTP
jgi:aminoglycoside 6'-N-acetyltransferase